MKAAPFRSWLLAAQALFASLVCQAAEPRYTVVRVDTRTQQLRSFLGDESGQPFHTFDRLAAWLQPQHLQLQFAMNAGMYHPDYSPVGLLVEQGRQIAPLNLAEGEGNFFMKPNGVFLVSAAGPRIVESSEYPAVSQGVRLATQSGPLLVRHGRIHPAFSRTSSSRHIRNGVGVAGRTAIFVISEVPVTFYEFAKYFRDQLHCADALYFDGSVSSFYQLDSGRNDVRTDLGPMIGVVR